MVEGYLRQSALAHLGLDGRAEESRGAAGVAMAERAHQGMVNVRVKRGDTAARAAFEAAFGFALPAGPNTTAGAGDATAFWLGPDEWWIVTPGPNPEAGPELAEKLRGALAGFFHAVTEVGESRTCIRLSGPGARAVLHKGCPLDLHPRVFQPGHCAQTCFAKATVLIHHAGDESGGGPAFDLYVPRSFAQYLWAWIEDAGTEYAVAVVRG